MLNNFLKRFIKKIFLIILIFQFAFFQFPLPTVMAAAGSQTLTSQADFEAGTLGSGLSSSQTPGDLRLDYQTSIRADTTAENFNLGNTFQDTYTTRVKNDSGGEVVINPVYNYNQYSSPVLDSGYVKNSFLDEARNLLYVSTNGGGLSVINTQGTIDPSDDTLVKTYTTATTPAIGNNYVDHSFLDSTHNLIYVSTGGGLSVINTQGTIDPADDTLIKTYTTATTPAIANNIVLDSFLDSTHNLIYVSTWGGLSAINTQGTIDPADDTLIKTYTTATTPAIGNNYVYHSFLDSAHNLIYVSTSGGGLSVINTQGTIDPADDTLVKTYTTATTPAIANNIVLDSFLDSTHNLIYVSTSSGGLSVINTQGTIDPADDTLVKTYTTATTPAIGNNYVLDSFLDSTHNLIYVSTGGGLSVINTQGTIDPADDTLVKTYTTATTPAIGNNIVRHSFFDSTHNLIYVSTRRGLSVINLNNTYNTQGVYTKDVDRNSVNLWQTKTAIPTARFSAATGVISEKIYVAGGVNRDTFNILEAYDPVTNTWSTKASMSTGRNSSVSGVINGKLYVAGGKDTDYNALSSLEIYDPATDTWSAGPAMSTKRIGAVGDVYNGKLYVMGGMTGACNNNSEQSMEVYDPDTDTWSTLAPAPIVKSTSGTAKFINGKMYVAGGQNWCDITFSNSLIVYDPATNTWDSAKAPMPYGRAGGTSAVVDGKFLYIGGTNDDWDSVNDIFIYDLVTDSWGIYSTLPDVLHRPMANVIDNNLYVAGGRNSDWDQVDTNYLLSSDFLSDSYQKETYSKISWTATTPDGTSVEMLYSLNSGQTYESLGATQGTYYLPADSSAYSLRYKAILSTDDVSATPSLDSVTVYLSLIHI